eukprot:SAG11_NODE_328_length_10690_cov_25.464357_1_plen_241_part_00
MHVLYIVQCTLYHFILFVDAHQVLKFSPSHLPNSCTKCTVATPKFSRIDNLSVLIPYIALRAAAAGSSHGARRQFSLVAMPSVLLLAGAAAMAVALPQAEQVFSVYDFGARGDGKHNDTAAIQATMNAAATAGEGVAHLPHNGTYLIGGGLNALGHAYDGVTLRVDGAVTIPGPTAKPAWSTPEQCGTAEHVKGSGGKAQSCRAVRPARASQPLRCHQCVLRAEPRPLPGTQVTVEAAHS